MILGIDEVGRGAWAGPLVVGAVVLSGPKIDGLTDSKALSKKRREQIDLIIREQTSAIGLGWVYPEELDRIGLTEALKVATIRAVKEIKTSYHEIIIDGTINFLSETSKGEHVTTIKKADLLIPSVSAASIVAKVARDNYMALLDESFPDYGFSRHVGYGTAFHSKAIEQYGPTEHHRKSFAPIAALSKSGISSKSLGDHAEEVTEDYLKKQGHRIIDRNWKTRFCEIDIISEKDQTIYFTEVKYRKRLLQGGGVAAVTKNKLRQMGFASELFVVKNKLENRCRQLAVASLSGDKFKMESWTPLD